ncbi:MAG: hypothetical protein KGL39_34730 [Patescibacteria group bacterium]|nr:hypothetical protein [Patescibacteria group bacterium]
MAVRYIGMAQANPQVEGDLVVGASSGGTLAGSQDVQVVFDDTLYDSSQDGKQRLLAALEVIFDRIASAKSWPIDSTS